VTCMSTVSADPRIREPRRCDRLRLTATRGGVHLWTVRIHIVSWLAAAALFACRPAPDERVADKRVSDERTPEERISEARVSDALRICTREMAFKDPRAPVLLGACSNSIVAAPDLYMLDDPGYAAYIRCRDAARTMDESLACTREAENGKWTPKTDAELAMDRAEAAIAASEAERLRKAEDEQLARLGGLVAGGAIDASTIAELRAQRSSAMQSRPSQGWPPQRRFYTIVQDAASLIEAGRVAPGHKLAIQLPPPADVRTRRPGSTGAELVFVDSKTSRVVARIAPISKEGFRDRNGDIEELLKWAAEDPERRDLEFELELNSWESGADAPPPPDVFNNGNDALGLIKESGLDKRKMIRVGGTAMTPGEWIKNPDLLQ